MVSRRISTIAMRYTLMRHRPTDSFIACVRLVRVPVDKPGELLPFEQLCTNVNAGTPS